MKPNMRFALVLSIPIILVGCGKGESNPTAPTNSTVAISEATVGEIFKAGMSAYSKAPVGMLQAERSSGPRNSPVDLINVPVEGTVLGPEGGNIHVTGSITGSFNYDKDGNFLGGVLLLGFTETITDYAFRYNGQKYTANGAPYISLTGTFTITPAWTFGTASDIQIGGGVRAVGPSYDHTANIHITININSGGTGGDVSGTIDGQAINYTF